MLNKLDGPASVQLLKEAKENGCITTFDLIATNEETINIVKPLLPFIDYFMPSIEEARDLSQIEDSKEIAKFFIDNGAKNCIFTMGDEGSVFISKEEYIKTPAFEIDVVDTTGCGDAFDAGMITAIVKGFDLEKALKFATITSGLVATGLGSDAGIKSFEDSLEKMNNLKHK